MHSAAETGCVRGMPGESHPEPARERAASGGALACLTGQGHATPKAGESEKASTWGSAGLGDAAEDHGVGVPDRDEAAGVGLHPLCAAKCGRKGTPNGTGGIRWRGASDGEAEASDGEAEVDAEEVDVDAEEAEEAEEVVVEEAAAEHPPEPAAWLMVSPPPPARRCFRSEIEPSGSRRISEPFVTFRSNLFCC